MVLSIRAEEKVTDDMKDLYVKELASALENVFCGGSCHSSEDECCGDCPGCDNCWDEDDEDEEWDDEEDDDDYWDAIVTAMYF